MSSIERFFLLLTLPSPTPSLPACVQIASTFPHAASLSYFHRSSRGFSRCFSFFADCLATSSQPGSLLLLRCRPSSTPSAARPSGAREERASGGPRGRPGRVPPLSCDSIQSSAAASYFPFSSSSAPSPYYTSAPMSPQKAAHSSAATPPSSKIRQ